MLENYIKPNEVRPLCRLHCSFQLPI